MREYSNKISLTKNSRGVYSLDPSMGCTSGLENEIGGCFGDCYANRISKIYGYDFSKTVYRNFEDDVHLNNVIKQINKVKLPFIRMGTMGDPSEDWQHTLNICKKIQYTKQLNLFNIKPKEIVIITKHWNKLSENQLQTMSELNICVNTSLSVFDSIDKINYLLNQYERIKPFCKSILRMVTFDFNKNNPQGKRLNLLQNNIIKNYDILDTVFRASKSNKYVKNGVINISKTKFLGKNTIISKLNKKTYFGNCNSCLEMCGVNISVEN